MNFAEKVISYHYNLKPDWKLPKGFELIFPFDNEEAKTVFSSFYKKYFSDSNERIILFGINPGRFGAGITGVPFTDPFYLEEVCKIKNDFSKRKELSAIFIYEMIEKLGGVESFYSSFYINSLCPLGFIKDKKNANYYDDKKLEDKVTPRIKEHILSQIALGCSTKVAFSLGQGKNFKYFKKLNDKQGYFDQIIPLPHPRWVMQYKLKSKEMYLDEVVNKLNAALI